MNLVGNTTTVAAGATSANVLQGIPIAQLAREGTVRVRSKVVTNTQTPEVSANLVLGTEQLVQGAPIPYNYVPSTPAAGLMEWHHGSLIDAEIYDGPTMTGGIVELTFRNSAADSRLVWWEYAITF